MKPLKFWKMGKPASWKEVFESRRQATGADRRRWTLAILGILAVWVLVLVGLAFGVWWLVQAFS